jgi:4-amino-4-deoxy-L-arabinose transferase-like glycosyltransferase
VLEGLGPQEPKSIFTKPYDHPYFGQILLAASLGIYGYPTSLSLSVTNVYSIEMILIVPRVLMGILAVIDTFLVYKIAERRYPNQKIAFIASVLFAVMPITWILRRIYLDNLLLPLLLSSVLFALYSKSSSHNDLFNNQRTSNYKINYNGSIIISLISGIFLGLAIFTKMPVFSVIPIVAYIIFINNKKSFKILGIWIIPVILIPLIWPAYATYLGEFGLWQDNVLWQAAERVQVPLLDTMDHFLKIDPVFFVLGMAGIFFAVVKKDTMILLWIIPYIVLLQSIGHVAYWHLALILAPLCIGAARLIMALFSTISRHTSARMKPLLSPIIISIIGLFGLISSSALILSNVTVGYFQTVAFLANYLPSNSMTYNDNDNTVTLVGGRWLPGFSWILTYIFDSDIDFKKFYTKSKVKTDNILLIVDNDFRRFLSSDEDKSNIEHAQTIYDSTKRVAEFKDEPNYYQSKNYPYNTMDIVEKQTLLTPVEIRANY